VDSLLRQPGQLRRIGAEPNSALLAARLEVVPFPYMVDSLA